MVRGLAAFGLRGAGMCSKLSDRSGLCEVVGTSTVRIGGSAAASENG